jgi:hypothetical protein
MSQSGDLERPRAGWKFGWTHQQLRITCSATECEVTSIGEGKHRWEKRSTGPDGSARKKVGILSNSVDLGGGKLGLARYAL